VLLLSKIATLLIYPLSLSLLCFVLAALWRRRGGNFFAGLLTLIAVSWLYFCSTEWGANTLMTPLEAAYPAFSDEELPRAEAIVVLGGAINGETRFGQDGDFNQAADRLWRAAALYLAGKAPLLVLSGGARVEGELPGSHLMAEKLASIGIPRDALVQESESRTTRENGQQTHALLRQRDIQHILLVTSASHMRRASAVFVAQGFAVTAVATDHQMPLRVGPVPGWLPTVERLGRSTRAIHEWFGYWVYDHLGYFEARTDD
jgi:uncharacterized SAM-binding protein YcdF (DUF218 family)